VPVWPALHQLRDGQAAVGRGGAFSDGCNRGSGWHGEVKSFVLTDEVARRSACGLCASAYHVADVAPYGPDADAPAVSGECDRCTAGGHCQLTGHTGYAQNLDLHGRRPKLIVSQGPTLSATERDEEGIVFVDSQWANIGFRVSSESAYQICHIIFLFC